MAAMCAASATTRRIPITFSWEPARGQLFSSNDGGHNWSRLAHLGASDDYVLDHIAIDSRNPNNIFVAAWSVENQQAGDIFRSADGGKNLGSDSGHARQIDSRPGDVSLRYSCSGGGRARWRLPHDDGGSTWQRISSSEGEVKNIESIAVDPVNPNLVYAGSWHLPWKTSDGGATWQHINKGMIEDSDVFRLSWIRRIRPPFSPAPAPEFIRRQTGGELFQKLQGIPFTARRTRVLEQDPSNSSIVYAGTTEGLWKTEDAGKTWKRMSGPEVVVNDVLVDPRNSRRVLLATDRGGVLASDNGGQSSTASNHGYTHRYVTSLLADESDPNTIFVGVLNDREGAGCSSTHDAGRHWQQKSEGLGGRDVFALRQASNGTLIAGTNRGAFELLPGTSSWHPINEVVIEKTVSRTVTLKSGKKKHVTSIVSSHSVSQRPGERCQLMYAGGSPTAVYRSEDSGETWKRLPDPQMPTHCVMPFKCRVMRMAQHPSKPGTIFAALEVGGVMRSTDGGESWKDCSSDLIRLAKLPHLKSKIASDSFEEGMLDGHAIAINPADPDAVIVAVRMGLFRTADGGDTWQDMEVGRFRQPPMAATSRHRALSPARCIRR